MSPGRRAAWLPSPSHELLLRAALGDGDRALRAWREWSEAVGPEESDVAALQVMPLAWRNLSRLDPGLDGLEHLKGVYRFVWVKNQVLLGFGEEVLRKLERAGIETLVLKGAALSLLHYQDLGVRLMADFDVLVPRDRALDAIDVLSAAFSPEEEFPDPAARVPLQHGVSFAGGRDRRVDLHWYSLWHSSPDDDLWAAAVPIEINGARTRAPCVTDALLQTCAHGVWWHAGMPMLRWIADAVTILRSEPGPDWDRFIQQARRRELTATLLEPLVYLRGAFDTPVPEKALNELRRSPLSIHQRIGRRVARRPDTAIGGLLTQWERYQRLKKLDPAAPRQSSFAAQLSRWWGFDSTWRFSLFAARRALGRK